MLIQNTNQTQYSAQPSTAQHHAAEQSTLTQTATSLIGSNKTLLEAAGTQPHILQFMHKATDIQIQELTAKLNDTLGQGSSGAPQHFESLHPEFQTLYINTHQHITSLKKLAARNFQSANNNPDDYLKLNLTAKGMGGARTHQTNTPSIGPYMAAAQRAHLEEMRRLTEEGQTWSAQLPALIAQGDTQAAANLTRDIRRRFDLLISMNQNPQPYINSIAERLRDEDQGHR